jgi:hypothetical protein
MHILTKGTIAVALTIALLYFTTANAKIQTNTTAKANMTASKAVANATTGMNKTGSELGKNASQAGKQILNKTEEIGKKIAGGLGSLLGNASEKLKQSSK